MRKVFCIFLMFFLYFSVFSSTGDKLYVSVKNLELKAAQGNFAKKTGIVNYGDEVSVLEENGRWVCVEKGSIKGWTQSANLSKRKILKNYVSTTAEEIALAGKGFGEESQSIARKNAITANFYQINATEKLKVPEIELLKFIDEGSLNYEDQSDSKKSVTKKLQEALSNTKDSLPKLTVQDEVFSAQQEYAIGRAVTANILATYKIQNNAKTNKYLSQILNALTLNCESPQLYNGFTVFVLNSDEINAFATSAGHILVTRGLINCASSEDELAAVLAHELSHILLKHSISAIKTNRTVNSVSEKIQSGLQNVDYLSDKLFPSDVFEKLSDGVSDISFSIVEKGYSQTQEFEADSKALQLLNIAGYNPEAMVGMLQSIRNCEEKSNKGMKNHPPASLRIKNVQGRCIFYSKNMEGTAVRKVRFEQFNR